MTDEARIANRRLSDMERGQGREIYESLPRQIQLEPTNRCNLSCRSCARNVYSRELNPPADLSRELLDVVRPLFVTAEEVLLGGYGEPLLCPDFLSIAAAVKSSGAALTVVTNGTLLDDALAGALAELGADEIILSVDAACDELLKQARGVTLERLNAAVQALNSARAGGAPDLIVQMVLSTETVAELPDMVRLAHGWRARGLRAVLQKIYDARQEHWSLPGRPELAGEPFKEAEAAARELGLDLALPALQGSADCVMPLEMLLIRADGTVHGCCSAVFGGSPFTLELGSAFKIDPRDLWNAEPMRLFRRAVQGRAEFPEPCRECAFRVISHTSHLRFLTS